MSEQQLTEDNLSLLISDLKGTEMVILKFTADWCAPCKGIKPVVDEYLKKLPDSIKYYEIDIDDSIELYMQLKQKRMLTGIPAILAYKAATEDKDIWYIPDDSVLGGDKIKVGEFFDRCIEYSN